jgi:hypothetical protein
MSSLNNSRNENTLEKTFDQPILDNTLEKTFDQPINLPVSPIINIKQEKNEEKKEFLM